MTFRDAALKFHRFLVANQILIRIFFWMWYLSILVIILIGLFTFGTARELYPQVAAFARTLGQAAILVYGLTLLPGIFRRLHILPELRPALMLFRRQLGVSMFLMGYTHGLLLVTIPMIFLGQFPPVNLPLNVIFGNLSIFILLPLWLTSNDTGVRLLGRHWQTVHRLTYAALFFIFLHVAVFRLSVWTVIAGVLLALEIASWLAVWQRSRSATTKQSSAA